MNRKIRLTALAIFLFSISCAFAQYLPADQDRFAIGAGIQHQQNDFGLAVNLTSPYFASGAVAIRGQAGVN